MKCQSAVERNREQVEADHTAAVQDAPELARKVAPVIQRSPVAAANGVAAARKNS